MILLHRLSGAAFAVNPDLVARAESTPDTVLTLTDGAHLVVLESVAEVRDLVVGFRAAVLCRAWAEAERAESAHHEEQPPSTPGLRVLPWPAAAEGPEA